MSPSTPSTPSTRPAARAAHRPCPALGIRLGRALGSPLGRTGGAAIGLVALAACGDPSGPSAPPPISGAAVSGVSLDAATFRTTGTFTLGVVPTGANGQVVLDDRLRLSAALAPGAAVGATVTLVSQSAQPAGSRPLAAALNIDDSGSMASSDPGMLRAAASRVFWTAALAARPTNEVALADFGAGGTRGFTNTRLLQGWGRDTTRLAAALGDMGAYGGTPLYESALETLGWIDSTRAASSHQRVLVLMTDGQPNDDRNRDAAAALAVARGITVHTVGLGPASDLAADRASPAVLRVRELAYRTGGVYAAATSAAALDTIFQTIARVTSAGQFLATVRLSPVPASGTIVRGTIAVTSGTTTQQAIWSLVAP